MRASTGAILPLAAIWSSVAPGCAPATPTPLYELAGAYAATPPGATTVDPLAPPGDVIRFGDGRYLMHHATCDGGDAGAGDFDARGACTSSGTFAISADTATLSLTDDETGATSKLPFQVIESNATSVAAEALRPLGLVSGPPDGGAGLATGTATLTPHLVSLYKAGGQLYSALPCSGQSSNIGSDTGAMIRTATATSFSCIQSRITFPSFDVPNGPNGAPYCTSFSQPGCTVANYYGRRGVPFIYFTFVASNGRAECGFEYQPGLPENGAQGNPRWSPYIRDTAGAYVYGADADQRSGTTATVWCGLEQGGLVRMKIDGAFVNMTSGGATTPLTSTLSFRNQAVHAFRVTGLAWPETMTNIAGAKAHDTYFPPYTCQPMNQVGPVTYEDTLVCPGSSPTPSVPFVTAPGGNARWTAGGDGYTLSPSSEAKESQMGSTDTDEIFAGGG